LSDELLKEFEEIKTRKMKNYQLLFEKRNLEGYLETKHPVFTSACFYVDFVSNYVSKFRLKYAGQRPDIKDSMAAIDDIDHKGNPIKKPLGPVGFSFKTQILSFKVNRKKVEERICPIVASADSASNNMFIEALISSLITISYALKKAVCILQTCDLDDVETSWGVYEDHCYLFLFDNTEGGNGITYLVFSELKEDLNAKGDLMHTRLFTQISEILTQKCCLDACEECLLLPRTPNHIVDLLNKQLGAAVLGVANVEYHRNI
jgi:hypothetical protein